MSSITCFLADYFDLKRKHLGPWNDEPETLVIRYADCNLRCPICYAAGPSYLHRLMRLNTPINTRSGSQIQQIGNFSFTLSNQTIRKLTEKQYVRIQGGEPLMISPLNNYRIELTALLTIDILNKAMQNNIPKLVVVIQTNGIQMGQYNHARRFIDALIDYAQRFKIYEKLREMSDRYHVAIEISYKAPNPTDFAIFSGIGNENAFQNQINAYYNLMNLTQQEPWIRIYPIAGFLMPLSGYGIVPISHTERPLFDRQTWNPNFAEVIQDFWNRLGSDSKYSCYRQLLVKIFGTHRKIRGETITLGGRGGAVFFQRHIVNLYARYQQFSSHFNKHRRYFAFCPPQKPSRYFNKFSVALPLRNLSQTVCQQFKNSLASIFFRYTVKTILSFTMIK